jgi:uncharacterized protein YjbI with pentapeptide repeats
MEIRNRTDFAFAPVMGRVNFPHHTASLVVKAGYGIGLDGALTPLDPQPAFEGDVEAGVAALYDADLSYYKPQADLLLVGTCHAPGGKPVATLPVKFRVGEWEKSIAAIGNRVWKKGLVRSKIGEPTPFTSVELTWANAFGGPGYDANPAGRGRKDGVLPNLEYPTELITGTSSKPRPACFAPVHRTWKLRTRKTGTYGNKWLIERWPALPEDFDWTYFNAAPEDQQLRGFLRGDEEIELTNMHPEQPVIKASLPGVRVRVLLREHDELRLREVQMNLDTLYVDANKLELYLLWRGVANVSNDDWDEARQALIYSEPLSKAATPAEELLPLFDDPDDEDVDTAPEPERDVEAEIAALHAEIEKAEAQAAKHEEEVMATLEKQFKGKVDVRKLVAENRGKGSLADLDPVLRSVIALKPDAFPKWATPESLNPMNDPDVKEALKALEESSDNGRPADKPGLAAMLRSGEAKGGDFSGADLSGEDLSGADLGDVYLNNADLSGANLSGAKLTFASATGANFSGADLSDADLTDADLSRADLTGANLEGCKLNAAILDGARAKDARFGGAECGDTNFTGLQGEGADFTGAQLTEAVFSGANLKGAKFQDATLGDAAFDGVVAHAAVFDKAELAGFRAEAGDFTGASMQEVVAAGSVWEHAILKDADLRSADLTEALFPHADLSGANLYGADLTGAMLRRANLQGAKAGNANFFKALLEKADMSSASCVQSNFYGADFFEAVTDSADFQGSNLKQTKLADR